jgi:hypothetical protein
MSTQTIIATESPAQIIGPHDDDSDQRRLREIGSLCYYFTMAFPPLQWFSEIPASFEEGLKDAQEGRVIDLDVALTQAPRATIPSN